MAPGRKMYPSEGTRAHRTRVCITGDRGRRMCFHRLRVAARESLHIFNWSKSGVSRSHTTDVQLVTAIHGSVGVCSEWLMVTC